MKKIINFIKKGVKWYFDAYTRMYSTGYFNVNLLCMSESILLSSSRPTKISLKLTSFFKIINYKNLELNKY